MFERKDISKLKKDTILDVELLGSKFNLHTRWGVFSPRSIDDGTLLLMKYISCLLYTSPSPRDLSTSRMPSSA